MKGAAVDVHRRRLLRAPSEVVWQWLREPERLAVFCVNPFHLSADCDDDALRVGSLVRVHHNLGVRRELRVARITTLRPHEIAWSEIKAGDRDWFPHHQELALEPRDEHSCLLTNHLRGRFNLPGARWWLMSWYRHLLPLVLDLENRRIAAATETREHRR